MIKSLKLEDRNLESIPGVGPSTKSKLNSLGIKRITDLILFLPIQLIDKTKVTDIKQIINGQKCLFIGEIVKVFYTKGSRKSLILIVAVQEKEVRIRFIHKTVMYKNLSINSTVRFSGNIYIKGLSHEMIHPEIELVDHSSDLEKIVPFYNTRRIISQNKLRKLIAYVLNYIIKKNSSDIFDNKLLEKFQIPNYIDALTNSHLPSGDSFSQAEELFESARKRFIMEELISSNIRMSKLKQSTKKRKAFQFVFNDDDIDTFISTLPYKLTNSQNDAIKMITEDFKNASASSRLIQGDVGCGKTVVSAVAALTSFLSGHQTAYLVPTEILNDQHVRYLSELFKDYSIKVATLKNNLPISEKLAIKSALAKGDIDVIVGTHSLLNSDIRFDKLGLCIIDEQHRFGINQRSSFYTPRSNKSLSPHLIYMSATPIPRSLALVLYQGLDYTRISDMPVGRKKINTEIIVDEKREELIKKLISFLKQGQQIFWVCPSINSNTFTELESVYRTQDLLSRRLKDFKLGVLHGQLSEDIATRTLQDFRSGIVQLLICTTVIEVGIDVPNATTIVIEDADRFGLSQLHQLRGRVGRSNNQGNCFLVHKKNISAESLLRLSALVVHSDGFELAEKDLMIRGSGDYLGVRQSGHLDNYKLATLEDFLGNVDTIKQLESQIKNLPEAVKNILLMRWDDSNTEAIEL